MTPHPENTSPAGPAPGGTRLPAAEALRIAAQLTDTEEDLHAITRVVLALVGANDDLTGPAAEAALSRAGVPADARRLLMAALGPAAGRPSVYELRAALELGVATLTQSAPPRRTGMAGLIDELRGRRVTRTALWYVGGSVAVVEAANVFLPLLGAPDGIVRLLAIIAVCGLPLALTLSWTFDVAPAGQSSARQWPRLALIGGAAALSLGAAVVIWRSSAGSQTVIEPLEPAHPAHIAVLEFNTIGGDAELASFAAQLQVRLIDGLSMAAMNIPTTRARPLRVLSHAGVLPFARQSGAVDSLRAARRVGTVLEGTIIQSAGTMRVSVRLIDTETHDQIGTDSTRFQTGDRIALLDAVADAVLRLVRERLGPVVQEHMRLLETRSHDAFDRLTWANVQLDEFDEAFARGDFSAAERMLDDADSLLAEAEQHDARWIEPIVERGKLARRRVRIARARDDTIMSAIERGIAHAERALSLNPSDPRALVLRGELRQYILQVARPTDDDAVERIRAAAEQDLRASLVGNPAPAKPLRILSELAGSAGRLDEALSYGKRAYEQDPFMEQVQITVFRMFEYSFAAGKDEEAAEWCEQGRRRFLQMANSQANSQVFHDCRLALGAWSDVRPLAVDSAWALAAAELDAYPASIRQGIGARLHAMVAAVLARRGQADSARSVLRNARASRDMTGGVLRATAGVFGLLGEADSALATLQTLLRDSTTERRALPSAIELRPVLNDPRARALLATPPAGG